MGKPLTSEALQVWQGTQPVVYVLTELTGRRKDRDVTTYVAGVEVGRRALLVWLAGAIVVGMPLGAVTTWILAAIGLYEQLYFSLVPLICSGSAAVWLFVGRERQGLRLLRYQGLVDRRRAARSRGRLFVGVKAVEAATVNILIPVVIDTPIAMLHAHQDTDAPRPSLLRRLTARAAPPVEAAPTAWDEQPDTDTIPAVPDRWSTDR